MEDNEYKSSYITVERGNYIELGFKNYRAPLEEPRRDYKFIYWRCVEHNQLCSFPNVYYIPMISELISILDVYSKCNVKWTGCIFTRKIN
jgi:hypothetical protein